MPTQLPVPGCLFFENAVSLKQIFVNPTWSFAQSSASGHPSLILIPIIVYLLPVIFFVFFFFSLEKPLFSPQPPFDHQLHPRFFGSIYRVSRSVPFPLNMIPR